VVSALAAVILLVLPLIMIRAVGGPGDQLNQVVWWLSAAESIGKILPIGALFLGIYFGVAAWMDDTRGNHIYALSLPLSRPQYLTYRFVAGGLPVIVPSVALLAGSLAAAAAITTPAGIHAYPFALAGRMLLASLTCYSIFFAVSAMTRRAVQITFAVLASVLIIQLLLVIVGIEQDIIGGIANFLTTSPGPLSILTGRWALFDV
jgi:hypothetical protein